MNRSLALVVCLLALLATAAPASAAVTSVQVSSNEGPIGDFVPGDVGTLELTAVNNAFYRIEYRPTTHDYKFVSLAGNFVFAQGFPVDANITQACTGLGTTTMICPEALPGRAPYRLHMFSETQQMDIALRGDGNVVTPTAFPAESITVVGSNAGTTFENDSGSDVTFGGGSSPDVYKMGTGVEQVSFGGGIDTVDYSGYGSNRCVTVSLNAVADDAVHACQGSTLGALLESGDNVDDDVEKVIGGDGRDTITGNGLTNEIRGGGGFDDLRGGGGNDTLFAEGGGAKMNGGAGADVFDVDPGTGATITYGEKFDPVGADFDGAADDGTNCPGAGCEGDQIDPDATAIEGGRGSDTLTASAGDKTLSGAGGPDTLNGDTGNDTLEGGSGADDIDGGGGNDTILPGTGNDDYVGGSGEDTLDYQADTAGMAVSIGGGTGDAEGGLEDVPSSVENVKTGSGDDQLIGDGGPNKLFAGGGDDFLDGGGGADSLKGNPAIADGGCDVNRGGAGGDIIDIGPINPPGTPCNDVIDYSDHSTAVTVNLTTTLSGGQGSPGENDSFVGIGMDVIGTDQPDTMTVADAGGTHTLDGRGGVDILTGGATDDTFIGGLGDDVIDGGPGGSDTASYADRSAPVTADLDGVDDDGATGSGEADQLDNVDNLTGGSAGDELTGDGNANRIAGDGGDDDLNGLGGADTLTGGLGEDALDGGADGDDLSGGGDEDTLNGGDGGDTLGGGDADDTLNGGDDGDTLDGGPGANTENGGAGDDDITGGPSGGNTVDAGSGADDVNVRNSAVDTVACGADADSVVADEQDTTDADCEAVDRGLPPASDPPPVGDGGLGPSAVTPGQNIPPGAIADGIAPNITINPRRVTLSRTGVATLTVACPADEAFCAGKLALTTQKKVARPGQPKRKAKKITFGRKSFKANGGKSVKVKIKLKKADLALLKRSRKLATAVTASVSDAAGNTKNVSARQTLLAPRKR